MQDEAKSKKTLIAELKELRKRVAALEGQSDMGGPPGSTAEVDDHIILDRLNLATRAAHLGIWDWDIIINKLVWDDRMYELYGVKREQFAGAYEAWLAGVHPEDREFCDEVSRRARLGEIEYDTEFRIRWPNGEIRIIKAYGQVIREHTGKAVRMIGVNFDITAQRDIEKKIKSLSERYEAILETVPDIIAEVNDRKIYTWVNQAGRQFFGKEVIGREAAFFFEGEQDTYMKVQPLFNGSTEIFYLESWQRRLDGEKRLLGWWCRVMKDTAGNVRGALSTARDITEAKLSELALAEEKERLLVTLRSIGDGVIATDQTGIIELINHVAEELTGWTQKECLGKPLAQVFRIINKITRQPCDNPLQTVLTSGQIQPLPNQTLLISRSGQEYEIADSCATIRNQSGKIIGAVLVFRDVTEKQKLLDTISKNQKLESLGILAGGIAHDFNNLLGSIFGLINVALDESHEATTISYLTQAMGNIERAKGLTQQLLTFSKGGAPMKRVQPLLPFLKEAVQFALSGSNVSAHFIFSENLWNCNFDRNQLGQVVDNLIINAVQAMPTGGLIDVEARNIVLGEKEMIPLAAGEYVRILFKDQGIGIPGEILPYIFDPFFTTKQKGSGLGLSTCYSIISRHEGLIEAQSGPGAGSIFTIYLPASSAGVTSESLRDLKGFNGNGKILLMDDDSGICHVTSKMLRQLGFETICVHDGQKAIDLFREAMSGAEPFKAVILDLTVPGGMGGKETVEQIRHLDMQTPVFVSSGYANDLVMANPQAYGFTDGISKPFTRITLAQMLGKHLTRLRAKRL